MFRLKHISTGVLPINTAVAARDEASAALCKTIVLAGAVSRCLFSAPGRSESNGRSVDALLTVEQRITGVYRNVSASPT